MALNIREKGREALNELLEFGLFVLVDTGALLMIVMALWIGEVAVSYRYTETYLVFEVLHQASYVGLFLPYCALLVFDAYKFLILRKRRLAREVWT